MTQNRFPDGWDEDRVQRVLDHYEDQTEDEAVAEDESTLDDRNRKRYQDDLCDAENSS